MPLNPKASSWKPSASAPAFVPGGGFGTTSSSPASAAATGYAGSVPPGANSSPSQVSPASQQPSSKMSGYGGPAKVMVFGGPPQNASAASGGSSGPADDDPEENWATNMDGKGKGVINGVDDDEADLAEQAALMADAGAAAPTPDAQKKEMDDIAAKAQKLALAGKQADSKSSAGEVDKKAKVAEDFSEPVLDESMREVKRHVNLVFIGHVDAGKSTLCGHIMYKTGMVDDRTLEKFERDAKAQNRESWKYAWAMDITDTERAKGKTEECGQAWFKTEKKRFTILDAPGHKSFVPHMIGGASQADVGILVISARKGEFETGFEKGGQTREHAMLAKTAGVRQLIVVVNKMDDPTVEWVQKRFDEIQTKLTPYLRQVGYSDKAKNIAWIPISGLAGTNINDRNSKETCDWYSGPSLLEYLDDLKPPARMYDKPLRLPIRAKFKDMGVMVMGKLEAGTIKEGEKLVIMPNNAKVVAEKLFLDTHALSIAEPGDNIRIKLTGVDEEDIAPGHVLCRPQSLCKYVSEVRVKLKLLEHKSILTAGYSCIMHVHNVEQEVTFVKLHAILDKSMKNIEQKKPKFVRPGQAVLCKLRFDSGACVETYKDFQQLGRFMLRDEGKTIAVGIIHELLGDD